MRFNSLLSSDGSKNRENSTPVEGNCPEWGKVSWLADVRLKMTLEIQVGTTDARIATLQKWRVKGRVRAAQPRRGGTRPVHTGAPRRRRKMGEEDWTAPLVEQGRPRPSYMKIGVILREHVGYEKVEKGNWDGVMCCGPATRCCDVRACGPARPCGSRCSSTCASRCSANRRLQRHRPGRPGHPCAGPGTDH